jgi:hypothetical protein
MQFHDTRAVNVGHEYHLVYFVIRDLLTHAFQDV